MDGFITAGSKVVNMEKPRVLIQIALLNDGQIGVSSTSPNHVTNLGLLGVAQSMFQKQVTPKDPSPILKPEMGVL